MTRRLHILALACIATACSIAGSAGAQGQPPPRGIVKIAGELYRAQNDNHFTVFLVTPAGIIMADPINPEQFALIDENGDSVLSGAEIARGPLSDVYPPTTTYTDRHTVTLGGKRAIMVYTGVAHAPDSSAIYFPDRPKPRRDAEARDARGLQGVGPV